MSYLPGRATVAAGGPQVSFDDFGGEQVILALYEALRHSGTESLLPGLRASGKREPSSFLEVIGLCRVVTDLNALSALDAHLVRPET